MRLFARMARAVRGGGMRRGEVVAAAARKRRADGEGAVVADVRLPSSSMLRRSDAGPSDTMREDVGD